MSKTLQGSRIRLVAADVMSAPVLTVRLDTPVKDIAAMMLAHRISGLPVLTADGELAGIVSEADLLHKELPPLSGATCLVRLLRSTYTADADKAEGRIAADLMTTPVITVEESTSLHEAAALMIRRRINRVPVLRNGRVVGMVTRADVLRALVRPDEEIAAAVRDALLHELWVDVARVGIAVRSGVVYLDGEVADDGEKRLAERWIRTIDGVVDVESRLVTRTARRGAP